MPTIYEFSEEEWCRTTNRPVDECPFCTNEACNKCGAGLGGTSDENCTHDVVERHEGTVKELDNPYYKVIMK
jgi:hypothetical protein